MKIIYCQATFIRDLEQTLECIQRVSPHVDATVIAYDQSITPVEIANAMLPFAGLNVHIVQFEWTDNMPEMRNAYLEKAKELGADWVCVSDPDELYSEELAENIRNVITQYDTQGYNLIAVNVRDQFDNVEWLDELDLIKETPGGYRETEFWKPLLIFKVTPDIIYAGVGQEKNVHEMLTSRSGPIEWKMQQLPKNLYYTHKKSALRIWRNAARNMFIGGGGDNVGALNQLWVDLKRITTPMGINMWPAFEEFLLGESEHAIPPEFLAWTMRALQTSPTNYGTETRETAKFFYTHHKELVTDDVKFNLENPPRMTPEIELENYITRTYFQILGRHPDEPGKMFYVQAIVEGRLPRDQLATALRNSPEYVEKAMGIGGRVEQVPIKVPINVSVNVSEALYLAALQRSGVYWDLVKPKLDIGGDLLKWIPKRGAFLSWFYQHRDGLTLHDLVEKLVASVPIPDSIALCIMGYRAVLPMIMESIEVIGRYVDEIHIQGDDWTKADVAKLNELRESLSGYPEYGDVPKIHVHYEPWFDDFSDYKNKATSRANTEWVMILDHDEIPTRELAENLRDIIERSNRGLVFNIIALDVVDIQTTNGEEINSTVSTSGKPLIHWNVPDPYYGSPHIWLKQHYHTWKMTKLPYAYKHIKEIGTELPRSVRNVFLGGGGDNTREGNPLWVELRNRTKELEIDTWAQFDEHLKRGVIDEQILKILVALSKMEWKDDELTHPLNYYLELHPLFKHTYLAGNHPNEADESE